MTLSVTAVLAAAGVVDYSYCDWAAAERGSEAHKDIARLARTGSNFLRDGYCRAACKFWRECGFESHWVERRVSAYGIIGHPDAVGILGRGITARGKRCIVDYKTGSAGFVHPATGLQMALYGWMIDPRKWWMRIGVGLMPSGRYKLRVWDWKSWPQDLAVAKACVRAARGNTKASDWERIFDWKRRNRVR